MEGIIATDWARTNLGRGFLPLINRGQEGQLPDKLRKSLLKEEDENRENLLPLPDRTTYENFRKDYNRMMIIDHTEIEFVYSVCKRCGRRYITDTLILGEKGSPGREGPPLDGCSQCEGCF
ncbi:hypothetical protein KJ693_06055 [bacterium]|nr:hypothetical protein [bacterium]MBU1614863.1 hypothetical protein [bacterium]